MTEDDIERQKKWVELRADCTIHGLYSLLLEVIQGDVDRFNNLTQVQRRGRHIYDARDRQPENTFSLSDNSEHRRSVMVRTNSEGILVAHHFTGPCPKTAFEVIPEWNEEKLACDLKIDGKIFTIWQISQKAIGSLLFD